MKTLHQVLICGAVILSLMFLHNTSQAMNFDFSKADQINQWKDLAGTMAIADGLLCSMKDAGGPLVSMVKDWKNEWADYTITVKAQGLVADADWGISFRVKDIANFYSWQFCNGNLMFVTYVGGARTEAWKVAQAEVLNTWQDYKVVVKGNKFDLYFGGKLSQSVTHDALKTGSVGTFVWINGGTKLGNHGGVAFDDFSVDGTGIPGALTAVELSGKLAVTWAEIKK
jgi:hypothetical protein